MQIPIDLLKQIFQLPPGVPARLVINTNGKGEWKTELTLFSGVCAGDLLSVDRLTELLHIDKEIKAS